MNETSQHQTRHTYRPVGGDDEVLDQKDLPSDGEALAWAEDLRGRTPGLTVRRVERLDERNDWVFVSQAGRAPTDESQA